jgi:type I restriction enzyme R subunit
MPTDTTERGLERLICTALTGHPCDPLQTGQTVEDRPATYGAGWIGGRPEDYDREYCVDMVQHCCPNVFS